MKIFHIASECIPFSKSGGLADVVYSLSKQLANLNNEVSVIVPFYKKSKDRYFDDVTYLFSYSFKMSWRDSIANIYFKKVNDVSFYLIENSYYFDRFNYYGEYDDGERFAFFTMASYYLFQHLDYHPDIIHLHDWQVGMFPVLVKENNDHFLEKTKTVFTIHNLAFQGLYSKTILGDFYNLSDSLYENGQVRFKGQVSTLKSGIIYADKITTVSISHRDELLSPYDSMGLNEVIRYREFDFLGITNGIDYDEFSPSHDKLIPCKFDLHNVNEGKAENNELLLKRFDLRYYGRPTYGIVSRLTWQKGTDILWDSIERLCQEGCNVIVLGSGERFAEQKLESLRATYPDKMGIYIGYNDEIAHLIYSGSDFFLMPSLFEPCGIGQMIAQRYGTLPIVRLTGGLKDTVIPFDFHNVENSDGFGFFDFSSEAFLSKCLESLKVFDDKNLLKQLRINAMRKDNSWEASAKKYLMLYSSML